MTEIEKKIQEAKNERQNIKNDIAEKITMLRVREAELRAIESFIDQLNDLKNKIEQAYYLQLPYKIRFNGFYIKLTFP